MQVLIMKPFSAKLKKIRHGCDVILWDGGNNDFPFYKPDLMITVTDPHRAGHELNIIPVK